MPITAEELVKAGWKKYGNAWYKNGTPKGLTNHEGKWQLWSAGVTKEVTTMGEL